MFLKKSVRTINGKTYCHYKIVESYREGEKIKHRILFPLGALSDEQAERLRLALSAHSRPDIVVAKTDQIVVTKHVEFLPVAVLHHVWQEWGFPRFFHADRWVEPMIINRIVDPVSKFGLKKWMPSTILPAYLNMDPYALDPFEVYRELDRLYKQDAELQSFLFQQLQTREVTTSEVFFYDITSTYVTGNRCVLATLGYSRDHRPDCNQIVIALMITPEGYPFYWRVLEGNTQDITTIQGLIQDVKARFGVKQCTMVFDRGMVSVDNLAALEGESWQYVSAMDRDEILTASFFDTAVPEPLIPEDYEQTLAMREFLPVDDNAFLYYRECQDDSRRVILVFDVARFHQERRALDEKLAAFRQWVADKNQSLRQAKKSRRRDVLEREIRTHLQRKRLKKLVHVQLEPYSAETATRQSTKRTVTTFQLTDTIDPDALAREQRLHGITCFITNVPNEHRPAPEIIQWYRRKNKVEEAFREIKTHLELRPIYLTRDPRVIAHVTVCILACFLFNDIEQRLKKSGSNMSPESLFRLLAECKVNQLSYGDSKSHVSVTQVSDLQREALKAIRCESVVDPKMVNPVLKKAENWL
jgi:transposase